jgi:hypothetical protein
MIRVIRPFTKLISKFKAAKLIRGLVDMDAATGYEVQLWKECFQWATDEKRIFLRLVRSNPKVLKILISFFI